MEAILTQTLWCDINRLQHRTFSAVSADLSQCFDSVGHAQCSLALQGFGALMKPVATILIALQIMKLWLRNAYNNADFSFGETWERPYMGLGQGSGGSNPGFTLTATPIISAYKRKKFYAEMKSAWSGLLMTMAAIMYVDDMDMLLRAKKNCTTEEFFEFI